MSKTGNALLFKFLMTLIFAGITFTLIDGNAFRWAFIVALLGTAANYLVGDLLVLPSLGNIIASIGDGILATLIAYLISLGSLAFDTTFSSLAIYAILVAVGEYFFHQYLLKSDEVAP